MTSSESTEMRGRVIQWDGKHGVIRTVDGIDVDFFPVHLVASGYTYSVKIGDCIRFRCQVISRRDYCLDVIRAVAVS